MKFFLMKKVRFFSYFVVFLLLANFALSPVVIFAAENDVEISDDGVWIDENGCKYVVPVGISDKRRATMKEIVTDFENFCEKKLYPAVSATMGLITDNAFEKFFNWLYDCEHIELSSSDMISWVEDDGSLSIPSDFFESFYNQFNIYISETQGFYVEPALTHNLTWVLNHLKFYSCIASLSDYSEITAFMGKNNFFSFSPFSWMNTRNQFFMYGSSASYVVRLSDNCFYFYDDDLNLVEPEVIGRYDIFDYTKIRSLNFTLHDIQGSFSPEISLNSYSGPYWLDSYYGFKTDTKVFSSLDSLNNYLYGQQSIYMMSGINDRIQDLTLTVDALNADYQKYNKEAYEAIIKAIEENKATLEVDTLTEDQLRDIVDEIIGNKLDKLNSLIASGNDTSSFQNQLIYEKLEQIYVLLKDWYHSDPVAGELDGNSFDVKGYFDSLFYVDDVNVFLSILDELTLLYQSVVDIDFTVINNNTFNTEFDVDIVINSLSPSVERMSTTFPFCIPWDMYACFRSLAAEPSAPCFVVPFAVPGTDGVVPEMVIDLSSFSILSALCRAFLVIIFCFGLMKLTFKIMEVF